MSSSLFTQTGVPADHGAAIADAINDAVGRAERAAEAAEAVKDAIPAEVAEVLAADPTIADHTTRIAAAEAAVANHGPRLAAAEADVADHETRIVSLETTSNVALPVFVPAASSVLIDHTAATVIPMPVVVGQVDTLTIGNGATAISGTVLVNGSPVTLPAAIAEGSTLAIDYPDNPTADIVQNGELVLTASNDTGTVTHTISVGVDIRIPTISGPATLTLDETTFTLIGASVTNADVITVVSLPGVGTYYESEGGPTLVAGGTYDANILSTMGAIGGAVNGSGNLVLRASNENATVTLTIAITVDVDQLITSRNFSLAAGTTAALGVNATGLAGTITVTAVPTSGAVERFVPGTAGSTGFSATWPLNTSAEDPTMSGSGAPAGLSTLGWIESTTGSATFSGGAVECTRAADSAAFMRLDAAFPSATYDTAWSFKCRLLLPSGGSATTSMFLFSHTQSADSWSAAHTGRFVLMRSSTDVLQLRLNTTLYSTAAGTGSTYFLHDGQYHEYEVKWSASDNVVRWYRDGVQHATISDVTSIWSPQGLYQPRFGSTHGGFSASGHAMPIGAKVDWIEWNNLSGTTTPDTWDPLAVNDTITEGELEGLRVNAGSVAVDTAMGTFSWRSTNGAAEAVGEDITLSTLPGTGGGGTPGTPDPERLTLTIQPLDGPLAFTDVSIDTSQAVLLDNTTAVRGGVQYRWLLPPLDLGAVQHTDYPSNQTDVLHVYLTYIDGGTYDGRYELIFRMPFKTAGQGGGNHIGRAYKWRITWDGLPVTLYPDETDLEQRTFPSVGTSNIVPRTGGGYNWEGHTRGTGFRWQSQKIEVDWTKLPALMADYSVMAHNDTFGRDTTFNPDGTYVGGYDGAGLGWNLPLPTSYPANNVVFPNAINRRYGTATVWDEWGSTLFSFGSRVGDVPRDQTGSGDRDCLGWEMKSAATAIVHHRKGETVARDRQWLRYITITDAIEQYPTVFNWNFTAHRAARPDDSGDRSNPYHTHRNPNVYSGNPNAIPSTSTTGWGRSIIDTAHLQGYGPTAYFLTEDPYYLELTQMLGMFAAIHAPDLYKQKSRDHVTGDQERGWAWSIRALNRAWKATPTSGAPSSRFLTKTALNVFQEGTRDHINDIINHTDTSGDGLPFYLKQDVCGTPARVYGILRRTTTHAIGVSSFSPYGQTNQLIRQTSVFMQDYIAVAVGMAVLGGATAFQPFLTKLANGFWKLRANTGGGFFVPYGVENNQPAADGLGDQGIRDGAVLYLVNDAEADEGTEPYRTSTARFDPTAWRQLYITHGIQGPDQNRIFTNTSTNGYLDWQRLQLAYAGFKLIEKAQNAGLITSDVDYTAKLEEFYDAIDVSPSDPTPMPRAFDPHVKWMMD